MYNIQLFPVSLQTLPHIKAYTRLMDRRFGLLKTQIYDRLFIYNLETAPDELLGYFALQFKTDGFEFAASRDEKLELIGNALDVRLQKGTLFALKKIFASINIDMIIHQWYEYGGSPYTFRVEMKGKSLEITPVIQEKIVKLLGQYSNKRSHLDDISLAYLTRELLSIIQSGSITETYSHALMPGG